MGFFPGFLFQGPHGKHRSAAGYLRLDGKREMDYFSGNSYPELLAKLESALKKYLGVEHAIHVGSGSIALDYILQYLAPKSRVLMQPLICDNLAPIIRRHCPVGFSDISLETYNLDLEKLEKNAVKQDIVLAVHTYGKPVDMPALQEIAQKKNLTIIEDFAHALGAELNGKKAGSFSDYAFFSLRKNMPVPWGGAIVTNDSKFAARALDLRKGKEKEFAHGDKWGRRALFFRRKFPGLLFPYAFLSKYSYSSSEPMEELLSKLGLAIALVQLEKLDATIKMNNLRAGTLSGLLSGSGIELPRVDQKEVNAFTRYVARFPGTESVQPLIERLRKKNFETGMYYGNDLERNVKNVKEFPASAEAARTAVPLGLNGLNEWDLKELSAILAG